MLSLLEEHIEAMCAQCLSNNFIILDFGSGHARTHTHTHAFPQLVCVCVGGFMCDLCCFDAVFWANKHFVVAFAFFPRLPVMRTWIHFFYCKCHYSWLAGWLPSWLSVWLAGCMPLENCQSKNQLSATWTLSELKLATRFG